MLIYKLLGVQEKQAEKRQVRYISVCVCVCVQGIANEE